MNSPSQICNYFCLIHSTDKVRNQLISILEKIARAGSLDSDSSLDIYFRQGFCLYQIPVLLIVHSFRCLLFALTPHTHNKRAPLACRLCSCVLMSETSKQARAKVFNENREDRGQWGGVCFDMVEKSLRGFEARAISSLGCVLHVVLRNNLETVSTQWELGRHRFGLGLDLGFGVGLDVSPTHKTRPDNFRHILHVLSQDESFGGGGYVWSGSEVRVKVKVSESEIARGMVRNSNRLHETPKPILVPHGVWFVRCVKIQPT